jgi:hypothetical protein
MIILDFPSNDDYIVLIQSYPVLQIAISRMKIVTDVGITIETFVHGIGLTFYLYDPLVCFHLAPFRDVIPLSRQHCPSVDLRRAGNPRFLIVDHQIDLCILVDLPVDDPLCAVELPARPQSRGMDAARAMLPVPLENDGHVGPLSGDLAVWDNTHPDAVLLETLRLVLVIPVALFHLFISLLV